MVSRLEQAVSPPLQSITNVDCDAALNGINGCPVLGCGHSVPDVANLFQVRILINILSRCDLKPRITCNKWMNSLQARQQARQQAVTVAVGLFVACIFTLA